MKTYIQILTTASALLLCSCSSEMAKRSAYESLQNKAQLDCRQRPGANCQDTKNYDEYQRSLDKRNQPDK